MTAILTPDVLLHEPINDRLFTADDMLHLPGLGRCELIRGKVVPVCRPNNIHGLLVAQLAYKIQSFVYANNLGMVFAGDSGIFLERDPDTVRGPDLHFVRSASCPKGEALNRYLETPPGLCIEILSPSDQKAKVDEKIKQYLKFGVQLIWVFDPALHTARIHRLDGSIEEVAVDGTLSGEAVLPGFGLSLAELFESLEPKRIISK